MNCEINCIRIFSRAVVQRLQLIFIFAIAFPFAAHSKPVYSWFGDLRARAQFENRDLYQPRLSARIRARFGVDVSLDPTVRAVIRLATAKGNRNTNQPLGDPTDPGSARRFFGLDHAYAQWAPWATGESPITSSLASDPASSPVQLYIGRIPQTQIKVGGTQIILDDDVALEGAALTIHTRLPLSFDLFFNTGSTWIRENYDTYYSVKTADNMINWAQLALRLQTETQSFQVGFGFYNFTALQGKAFSDLSLGGTSFGNTEKPAGLVKNEFLPREFFAEWKAPLGSMTSRIFAQHVVNTMTTDPNRAWWAGWGLTENKTWEAFIAYAIVESDAVPGLFTSCFFAAGQTNSNGLILSSRWFLSDRLQLTLTQYFNRLEPSGRNLQYAQTHLDLSTSF